MDVGVQIDDRAVLDAFRRAADNLASPRRMLSDVGRYGVSSTRMRFRTQLDPYGNRWPPSERVQEHGGVTLRLTSRLRNSITWNLMSDGVEWGTNVKYAAVHQFGFYRAVRVSQHSRTPRVTRSYQVFNQKTKRLTRKSEKVRGNTHTVRAHFRIMRIPRRAFLGVSTADRSELMAIASAHLRSAVTGQPVEL